jgi:hypothetical protein
MSGLSVIPAIVITEQIHNYVTKAQEMAVQYVYRYYSRARCVME